MNVELGYFCIPTQDMERGRAFCGGLFGWQFAHQGMQFHLAQPVPGY